MDAGIDDEYFRTNTYHIRCSHTQHTASKHQLEDSVGNTRNNTGNIQPNSDAGNVDNDVDIVVVVVDGAYHRIYIL